MHIHRRNLSIRLKKCRKLVGSADRIEVCTRHVEFSKKSVTECARGVVYPVCKQNMISAGVCV